MRNAPETLYDKDSSKCSTNSKSSTDALQEEIRTRSPRNLRMDFVEERLFSLKAQDIADELTQIMMFIRELERFWFENSETLEQIQSILSRLRSGDRSYKYTKIVHVLTKYLTGIRDFTSTTHIHGVAFYKKLFESALVAIMQELDSLEQAY